MVSLAGLRACIGTPWTQRTGLGPPIARRLKHFAEDDGLADLLGIADGRHNVVHCETGGLSLGVEPRGRGLFGVERADRVVKGGVNARLGPLVRLFDVVAEVDDNVDVEIDEGDLRVDTYRSSGAGGQHVNTTDSAVRITHQPTGIVVQCQAERSQHKNRSKAMQMLRARLYEWGQDQKRKEMERFYGAKGEIAWGHQIRSYVMQPYTMVKDMRTAHETANVGAVLDGDIQAFVEAYLKATAGDAGVGKN